VIRKKRIAEILTDEEIPYFIEGVFDIGRQEIDPGNRFKHCNGSSKKSIIYEFFEKKANGKRDQNQLLMSVIFKEKEKGTNPF
jgi:hypothetical protein